MNTVSIAFLAGILGCAFVQPVPAAEDGTFKELVLHSFAGLDGQSPHQPAHQRRIAFPALPARR